MAAPHFRILSGLAAVTAAAAIAGCGSASHTSTSASSTGTRALSTPTPAQQVARVTASPAGVRLLTKVTAATNAQPVAELASAEQLHGKPVQVEYLSTKDQIQATYLNDTLADGVTHHTVYMDQRGCYALVEHAYVGATTQQLLPATGPDAKAKYSFSSNRISWKIPASGNVGAQTGYVTYNSRDEILRAYRAAFKDGSSKTLAESLRVIYPKALPASVPTRLPSNLCKAADGKPAVSEIPNGSYTPHVSTTAG